MKLSYKMTDSGANELRIGIIKEASSKHRRLLKRRKRYPAVKDRLLDDQIKDIERFFRSSWGEMLSGDHGAYIIEKDREIVAEEMAMERGILK